MRVRLTAIPMAALVLACTSTTTGTAPPPPNPCPDIVGNWKIIATRSDGDCDASKFTDTEYDVTMRKDTETGKYVAVLPAFGGCAGDFDPATCKFVANCEITADGKKVGAAGIEWTFDGPKLTGSEISRALPPLSDKSCTANYTDEGHKL